MTTVSAADLRAPSLTRNLGCSENTACAQLSGTRYIVSPNTGTATLDWLEGSGDFALCAQGTGSWDKYGNQNSNLSVAAVSTTPFAYVARALRVSVYAPTPIPTLVPTQPSVPPTPAPSGAPSRQPSPMPSLTPTTEDTASVSLSFNLLASGLPEVDDQIALKTELANVAGVDVSNIHNFDVEWSLRRLNAKSSFAALDLEEPNGTTASTSIANLSATTSRYKASSRLFGAQDETAASSEVTRNAFRQQLPTSRELGDNAYTWNVFCDVVSSVAMLGVPEAGIWEAVLFLDLQGADFQNSLSAALTVSVSVDATSVVTVLKTRNPTILPSELPTVNPSMHPTYLPTFAPSIAGNSSNNSSSGEGNEGLSGSLNVAGGWVLFMIIGVALFVGLALWCCCNKCCQAHLCRKGLLKESSRGSEGHTNANDDARFDNDTETVPHAVRSNEVDGMSESPFNPIQSESVLSPPLLRLLDDLDLPHEFEVSLTQVGIRDVAAMSLLSDEALELFGIDQSDVPRVRRYLHLLQHSMPPRNASSFEDIPPPQPPTRQELSPSPPAPRPVAKPAPRPAPRRSRLEGRLALQQARTATNKGQSRIVSPSIEIEHGGETRGNANNEAKQNEVTNEDNDVKYETAHDLEQDACFLQKAGLKRYVELSAFFADIGVVSTPDFMWFGENVTDEFLRESAGMTSDEVATFRAATSSQTQFPLTPRSELSDLSNHSVGQVKIESDGEDDTSVAASLAQLQAAASVVGDGNSNDLNDLSFQSSTGRPMMDEVNYIGKQSRHSKEPRRLNLDKPEQLPSPATQANAMVPSTLAPAGRGRGGRFRPSSRTGHGSGPLPALAIVATHLLWANN